MQEDSDFESDDLAIDEANYAMVEAAVAGHEFIVRLMLFRGANNYNETLNIAARRGHESIAGLMVA